MALATTLVPDTTTPSTPNAATARTTGLLYLGVGLTGMLGFLLIRPMLFDAEDPAATVANLLAHESLARAGIALELALVVTQVLAALWFFKLFRPVDGFVAGAIALFGTVNAVVVLGSAAALASALQLAGGEVADGSSHLLYVLSDNFWGVGNVFFGLWLIPMGAAALRSGWAPRGLGRLLVVGGAGYVLSAFSLYLLPDAPSALATLLVLPATAGEFWMVGWLLLRGLRRGPVAQ